MIHQAPGQSHGLTLRAPSSIFPNLCHLFSEFFSFISQIIIQQEQPNHYIDHHKNIDPSITKEFAEINLLRFLVISNFPVRPKHVHLAKTINQKSNKHSDKEETDTPDDLFIDIGFGSRRNMQFSNFFHHIFGEPHGRLIPVLKIAAMVNHSSNSLVFCFPFSISFQ